MATVKIQRVKSKIPKTNETIYYVQTKPAGIMSTQDIVENIVREGQIPRIYAQGVLDYLTTAMFDYMKAGLSVQVPGLGTFKVNVKSTAQTEEKKANAFSITGVKLQLIPFESVRQEMRRFKFELVNGETVESTGNPDEEDVVTPGEEDEQGEQGSEEQQQPKFTVTFQKGEHIWMTQQYAPGDRIVPPAEPEAFRWVDVPEFMPDHDITIYAQYVG